MAQMTTDAAIARAYLLATGKTTALTAGSTKYNKILALLNVFQSVWANQPGVDWYSLRSMYTVPGTVTATDTFAVTTALGKVSSQEGDFVRILHVTATDESDYTLVNPERLYGGGPSRNNPGQTLRNAVGVCTIQGLSLIFDVPFTATSPQFGGTIQIPQYVSPATLVGGTSEFISVDDPNWACFMAAAEYVRNDITKQNQYGNLVAQAKDSFDGMIERNDSQREDVYDDSWAPPGADWS